MKFSVVWCDLISVGVLWFLLSQSFNPAGGKTGGKFRTRPSVTVVVMCACRERAGELHPNRFSRRFPNVLGLYLLWRQFIYLWVILKFLSESFIFYKLLHQTESSSRRRCCWGLNDKNQNWWESHLMLFRPKSFCLSSRSLFCSGWKCHFRWVHQSWRNQIRPGIYL